MVNQFLALSLFVMLLSFFIILNSMSTFEITKAKPILKSLSLAFSEEALDPELEANIADREEEDFREGNTLDKLGGLFNARIKGVEVSKNRLGTMMRVRMPVSEFTQKVVVAQAGEASLNRESPLLPTLISLLQVDEALNVPYRMDVVLNLNDNPANVQNENAELMLSNLKSVASYAQVIENGGLPKKMLSAGLGSGPAQTIDLYFRRYEPFDLKGF